MNRSLLPLLAPFAALLGVQACLTDNPAAYRDILGRSVRPQGSETGGTDAGGGAGGPAGGSAPTAGAAPSGTGGMGEGGEGATGGGNGSGGYGASAGHPSLDPRYSPACFLTLTQNGEEILKGTPCTSEDPPLCYRPCGPNQVGWKTETCLAGVYAEGDCTFPPDKNYECYAIPDVIDTVACGLTVAPAATDPCTAPLCTSCNLEGFYQDTGGDVKEGFCTCRVEGPDGVRRWTCASVTAWPCPFSQGC